MATRYARGCDLSKVPKAVEVPKLDIAAVLGVDTSNPMLRALRIQQGLIKVETLPADLRSVVPAAPLLKEETK
jgi:hypothetical protein